MKIWRYLNIEKFYDLLDGNLYFTRADKFKDNFEGAITEMDFNSYVDWFYDPRVDTLEFRSKLENIWSNILLGKKKKVLISCWHISEHEDVGMWERYLDGEKGVAISSTINQICSVDIPNDYTFVDFPVKYIDYNTGNISDEIHYELLPFMYKRTPYISEKEYRFMIFKEKRELKFEEFTNRLNNIDFNKPETVIENMYFSNGYDFDEEGLKIKVNVDDLINEIILSPKLCKNEICEIIEKIKEKTDLNIEMKVKKSELIKLPYNISNFV